VRFHPRDFTIKTSTIDRYGASAIRRTWRSRTGASPTTSSSVLRQVRVHGGSRQGREPEGPEDRRWQCLEGPRSREFPVRPPEDTPLMALFRRATKNLGYHRSRADGEPARRLQEPRRDRARAVHLLRLLRALRVRGRREGGPDRDVLPVAHKTGRFKIINYANAFAIRTTARTPRASSTTTAWAAFRNSRPMSSFSARSCSTTSGSCSTRSSALPTIRRRAMASSAATTPTRRWRGSERLVRARGVQALHGRGRAVGGDRRPQRRQLRPFGTRIPGGGSVSVGQGGARRSRA